MPGLPFAQLGGSDLYRASLVLPGEGIFHADVQMSVDLPLPSIPQPLLFGGTAYTCTPIRSTDFAGVRSARLVGGTGGWRRSVPPMPYASPVGVPVATVLADVAALVAEIPPVVDLTIPPTLGTAWTRPGDSASQTLNLVLGTRWWMDPTGTVQSALRLPLPILTPFEVIAVAGAPGLYEIATDFPGDWTPGRTFLGPTVPTPITISRVRHVTDGTRFRTEVIAATSTDGLLDSVGSIVSAIVTRLKAELVFYVAWEMTVISASPPSPPNLPLLPPASAVFSTPATVSCSPTDLSVRALLPPMVTVPMRPGPDGTLSVPTVGSKVLVAFANADPGRPYIVALDAHIGPAVGLVQQLKTFCFPGGAPLTTINLPAAAASLLVALETLG